MCYFHIHMFVGVDLCLVVLFLACWFAIKILIKDKLMIIQWVELLLLFQPPTHLIHPIIRYCYSY